MNKCPSCGHIHGYDPDNDYKQTSTDAFDVLQQRLVVKADTKYGYYIFENLEILVCPKCGTLFAGKYSRC